MGDANLVRSRDLGENFECKFSECKYYFLLFVHTASTVPVIDLLSCSKSIDRPF